MVATMKLVRWSLISVAIFVFAIYGAVLLLPESPPLVTAAGSRGTSTSSTQWSTVASWSGQGIKSTESFSITGSTMRIRWNATNANNIADGILQIMVHDSKNNLIDLAANQIGNGSDVSYVRVGPGIYYLTMNSANMNWRVSVEEER